MTQYAQITKATVHADEGARSNLGFVMLVYCSFWLERRYQWQRSLLTETAQIALVRALLRTRAREGL